MRRLIRMLMLFLIILIPVFTGCDAPAGPEGPEGPEGPVGPAGEDGSMIYSGEGEPGSNIGDAGDYYLNTNTGEMYGPKDADGWGNPIVVLMGEDGSVILSGEGAPSEDTGSVGDYYFDESSGAFYGPKDADGWGSPTDLTGSDGEDGSVIHSGEGAPSDDVGEVGDYYLDKNTGTFYGPKKEDGWDNPIDLTGTDGQDGEDGSQIHSGSGAPDNELGAEGDYYLDEDNYDLYGPKTSSGWGTPLNLKGADGNANVTRYIFPGHDFSSTTSTTVSIEGIDSATEKRQSAWVVYLVNSPASYWAIPGNGEDGNTFYNLYHYFFSEITDPIDGSILSPSRAAFKISTENDVSGEQYDEIEIVRIEASSTTDNTKKRAGEGIIPDHLDVSDYEAVAKNYGFYRE